MLILAMDYSTVATLLWHKTIILHEAEINLITHDSMDSKFSDYTVRDPNYIHAKVCGIIKQASVAFMFNYWSK